MEAVIFWTGFTVALIVAGAIFDKKIRELDDK